MYGLPFTFELKYFSFQCRYVACFSVLNGPLNNKLNAEKCQCKDTTLVFRFDLNAKHEA